MYTENDIYKSVSKEIKKNQVLVLDCPLGGRITAQALEDQGYNVGIWHPAIEKQSPENCDAIVVSEPDRMCGSQIGDFRSFMLQTMTETDKKIVMIPARTSDVLNEYTVETEPFWQWVKQFRFKVI